MAENKPIGRLLSELGYVTEEQIEIALQTQKATPKFLGEILQDLDFVTTSEVAEAIAIQNHAEFVDIDNEIVEEEALKLVPKKVCESKSILPLKVEDNTLIIATQDINDLMTLDYLKNITKKEIKFVVSDKAKISRAVSLHYHQLENPIEKEIEDNVKAVAKGDEIDVARLVELILNNAIKDKATDIHITPDSLTTHIFYRIDGVLHHYYAIPVSIHQQITARIKIISSLDISEQRLPQDGAFSHSFLRENFDLRVSTLPTAHGENIVLRLLSKNVTLFNLKSLGFNERNRKKLENLFSKPYGIVLVTGPTGSGKTTTLYSALRNINSLEKNILTAEDPVEYRFAFIKQTQINEKAGYTFSRAIRHFMRQDPDVILIGEIRDEETAELAVRASITGHMVFSTLHTNDAIGTIPRLVDLGVKEYMIGSALLAVIAQRLVRKLCPYCKKEKIYLKKTLAPIFKECKLFSKIPEKGVKVYDPVGCKYCHNSGYMGREAVIEILEINSKIEEMIVKKRSTYEIEKVAREMGMHSMKDDALLKVVEGKTSVNEVKRVLL